MEFWNKTKQNKILTQSFPTLSSCYLESNLILNRHPWGKKKKKECTTSYLTSLYFVWRFLQLNFNHLVAYLNADSSKVTHPDTLRIYLTLILLFLPHFFNCHISVTLNETESESHSVMSDSLQLHRPYSSWNSLGQNTGVGSLSLLQGMFPTQGSNPGLPHCRWILYQLSHKVSPRILEWVDYPFSSKSSRPRNWTRVSCIAGRFCTNWAMRKAL